MEEIKDENKDEIKDLQDEVNDIKINLLVKKQNQSNILTPLSIDLIKQDEKRMLIFGCGLLGTNIIKSYHDKYKIYVYSRSLEKHQNLKTKYPNVEFIIGDIRDRKNVARTISLVFPTIIVLNFTLYVDDIMEMIKTNINGVQNIIDGIIDNQVYLHSSMNKKIIYFNNPLINTKSISEKLLLSVIKENIKLNIKFISIRVGNIIESKNSIINKCHYIGKTIFKTSFILNSDESTLFLDKVDVYINLFNEILIHGKNNHIYVPVLNSYTYKSILKYFSKQYNKPITLYGFNCNECIHETLIDEIEALRTIECKYSDKIDKYYDILPIREKFIDNPLYNSNIELLRLHKYTCPELSKGYNSNNNNKSNVDQLFKN